MGYRTSDALTQNFLTQALGFTTGGSLRRKPRTVDRRPLEAKTKRPNGTFLEPVHDLLSKSARKAKWMNCKLVLSFRSQFFHKRRHFSSQAKERSTTQR